MPQFFSFQQGSETNQARQNAETTPLLGRFRAVPRPQQPGLPGLSPRRSRSASAAHLSLLSAGYRGSVHVGYGALLTAELEDGDDDDWDEEEYYALDGRWERLVWWSRRLWKKMEHTFITPKGVVVKRTVDLWWSRWTVLVVFPALMAVTWCALPFPQYPLREYEDGTGEPQDPGHVGHRIPAHGEPRVQVNFWFFLFVYYGFYNFTALMWITKVFNLYSLNWWPQSLGFPVTISAIAVLSLAVPVPVYLIPETRWLTVHNTAWISWTFITMAIPVVTALGILTTNERHLGLRHSLSETQRIFTSSWWTGEPDSISRRQSRRRAGLNSVSFDPNVDPSSVDFDNGGSRPVSLPVRMRRRWLPASFVRFVWFCLALFVGLLAYVIGEAYAEIYLRTLPHNNLETIVYVYGWTLTVYLLDGLTGWILGGNEGERVGSYPLSWVFKLYFMLTYQTYVRALYARLRSPSQFILLQVLSSTGLIIVTPVLMSAPLHWCLAIAGLNGQTYGAYQKMCVRNVFIRFLAENASMLAFLGSVVVLHFGANRDVYPYFAFDDESADEDGYNFGLTFYASSITWACELVASFVVAGLIRWIYGVSVVTEGKLDLAVWPELLPTSVAVMLHVLQNMIFSIIRLQFR